MAKVSYNKLSGVELAEGVRKKTDEPGTIRKLVVRRFGIKPIKRHGRFNPYQMYWVITGNKRRKSTNPIVEDPYIKELYEVMFDKWK